jgi:phosphopantothenoylcysteine decarboxylase/phosphopantothenate--cysteine ligase
VLAGLRAVPVSTAEDMRAAVEAALPDADALLMAAAVADFRPAAPGSGKIKKADGMEAIPLASAPDILAATADRRAGVATLGFALETEDAPGAGDAREGGATPKDVDAAEIGDALASARDKLARKHLDQIALNVVSEDSGFETGTNRVTLLDRDGGQEALPLLTKDETAEEILDRFARFLPDRAASPA